MNLDLQVLHLLISSAVVPPTPPKKRDMNEEQIKISHPGTLWLHFNEDT